MSSTNTFYPNQKVFAKVRGYPPWPAKVLEIINEVAGKQKFGVYFYGSKETGVCKSDELYDYLEYRDKYGKPLKRKFHAEAMQEIELEIDPSQRKNGSTVPSDNTTTAIDVSLPTNNTFVASASVAANTTGTGGSNYTASVPNEKDSDDEYNLVIDENPTHKAKINKNECVNRPLKRKLSASISDMSITGNAGITPIMENSPVEMTSRSGRKIKPKKFLDEPTETFTPTPNKTMRTKSRNESVSLVDENVKNKKPSDGLETSANVINSTRAELHWDSSQNVRNLISLSENSGLNKNVKKDFKKALKKRVETNKPQQPQLPQQLQHQNQPNEFYMENENLELLKIEVQLLDADCRIKSSLSLASAECEECLHAMDEILDLKLNALMLKKHPEVVDTVRKLRKYVGNLAEWKLTNEQIQNFLESAAKIRAKADHIYNKFKILFAFPNGKSFFKFYSDEVLKFEKKTKNMSTNEFYGLVTEPYE